MDSEIGYINGMNLGVGINTASFQIHPSPALDNVNAVREVISAGGQEVLFRVELLTETERLTKSLEVSARASLKYGAVGSGSVRTSFLNSFSQNSYSVYVMVQVNVTNKQNLLDLSKINFNNEAANTYTKDKDEFIKHYGDSFVYGLITGGEFIGVLEIESSSASEFREIKASLSGKANYGLFTGSAQVSFREALEMITSSYNMKATVYRQGGDGILHDLTPEQLIKDALEFPQKVAEEKGFPRTALIIPYSHIPSPQSVSLDVSMQQATLEQLGELYQKFIKYQSDLLFVLDKKDYFLEIDVDELNSRNSQITQQINTITDAAKDCFSDTFNCNIPSIDISLLESILPTQIEKIDNLGKTWYEQESGWIGIWSRRGLTNNFDAIYSKPGEQDLKTFLTIYKEGKTIFVIRRDGEEGSQTSCTYTGTISEDERSVEGSYICHWTNNSIPWSAKISY